MQKSILITGCSSGIGYCTAHGLRQRGYRVFATARKTKDVARLEQEGFESTLLDLNDSESIATAVDEILCRTNNTLYAVFNNGGFAQPGAIEDIPREALRKQFETNVFGWHELTNQLIPVMRRQGHGRIIQNSSILGFMSLTYRGAYNASKHAIEALSDTLRLELRNTNIHVILIEPGPIESKIRLNSYRHYKEYIKTKAGDSAHIKRYETWEANLKKPPQNELFTLPPEAVLKKVIHALESPKPRIRYRVTIPTHLCAYLKRLLPDRIMDKLVASSALNN